MLLTLRHALATLVTINYGLASGIDESSPTNAKRLGVWLGSLLDKVAGLAPAITSPSDTFERPAADESRRRAAARREREIPGSTTHQPRDGFDVYLAWAALHVSNRQEHVLIRTESLETYLDPDIVATMVRNKRGMGASNLTDEEISPYVRTPVDRDLPVVLAARMSFPFPILLTAVKLGAMIDFSKAALADTPKLLPDRVGLPTAASPAICRYTSSITRCHAGRRSPYHPSDESQNVWMPESNRGGTVATWSRFKGLPASSSR